MISSTESKVIYNIIEVLDHVFYHNYKDTSIFSAIQEECDDVKKVMVEVLSLFTGNRLCDLIREPD